MVFVCFISILTMAVSPFPMYLTAISLLLGCAWYIALVIFDVSVGQGTSWHWYVPLLFLFFAVGLKDGEDALTDYDNVYRLDLKNGIVQQIAMLRSFEKGVLIRDPSSQTVQFIRWEQIDRVSRIAKPDQKPTICRIAGYLCFGIVELP